MARTPLELPDSPAAGTSVGTSVGAAADADDLLSQLAGNEIDRLLQEAESSAVASPIEPSIEAPKADPKVSSEPQDLQHNAEPALGAQIDNLLAEIQNPTPEPEPAAADATTADPSPIETTGEAAERTALLEAAGFSNGQDVAATAVTTETKSDTVDGMLGEAPIGQERSALLEAAGFQAPDGTPISPKPEEPAHPDDAPVPRLLKPLVWLNAPLLSRPPIVRQLVGGAAIVTLVNAVAIIGYVLLFKKH